MDNFFNNVDVVFVLMVKFFLLVLLGKVISLVTEARHLLDYKKNNIFNKMMLYRSSNIENIENQLDEFIDRIFQEFLFMNPVDGEYVSEKMELDMCKDINKEVSNRISKNLIHSLSIVYNTDVLSDVISRRVYIFVSGFVMEFNTSKK